MLYITGDLHGDWVRLHEIIKKLERLDISPVLFVAGDFGIWNEDNVEFLDYVSLAFKSNTQVLFIDGNHENFDLLAKFPIVERFGIDVGLVTRNIFHIPRGSIFEVQGKKILAFGGATSTDKEYRTPGYSWWPEEMWNYTDMDRLINILEMPDLYVDVVITHDAPEKVQEVLYHKEIRHRSIITKGLEKLSNYVDFEYWFFGHHHQDRTVVIDNKKFIGVYKEVYPLI